MDVRDNLDPTMVQTPYHPAHSKQLYWYSCPSTHINTCIKVHPIGIGGPDNMHIPFNDAGCFKEAMYIFCKILGSHSIAAQVFFFYHATLWWCPSASGSVEAMLGTIQVTKQHYNPKDLNLYPYFSNDNDCLGQILTLNITYWLPKSAPGWRKL